MLDPDLIHNAGLLMAAYLLAIPIGWDRERHDRTAGLRTFPLVAVASCGYLLVAPSLAESPEARARLIAGLITGIGFVGGGAIFRTEDRVQGTATATGLWVTTAVGIAVALQRWEVAVSLAAITFATFRWLTPAKRLVGGDDPGHGGTD